MLKAVLYKEWFKTRKVVLAILIVFVCFTGYDFLALGKNAELRGWGFLWKFVVGKNSVMIENLRMLPLIAGIVLGMVQFLPEMSRKRIKLTLHLPCPEWQSVAAMQGYGIAVLLALFALQTIGIAAFMSHYMVYDLVLRIVVTMLTWYAAGLCAYLWTATVILEPSWKFRAWEMVIAAGMLGLCFGSSEAMAYADKIVWIVLGIVVLLAPVMQCSIVRFKEGARD